MSKSKKKPQSKPVRASRAMSDEEKKEFLNRAKWMINEAMVSYVSLLDDTAMSLFDSFYEQYTKKPVYRQKYFRERLDRLKKITTARYDKLTSFVEDTQFYADLRDGADEYFKLHIDKAIDGYSKVFRGSGVANYQMYAYMYIILNLAYLSCKQTNDIVTLLSKRFRVAITGTEDYKMSEEFTILKEMLEHYDAKYDEVFHPSVEKMLNDLARIVEPRDVVKASGTFAMKHNPHRAESYRKATSVVFGVRWN